MSLVENTSNPSVIDEVVVKLLIERLRDHFNTALGKLNEELIFGGQTIDLAKIEALIASLEWTDAYVSDPADPEKQYEYWTGKYYDGRKVYGKMIAFGALPNSAVKQILHHTKNINEITYLYAMGNIPGIEYVTIPSVDTETSNNAQGIGLYANATHIRIRTRSDQTRYVSTIVTIEFTCTDR